MVDTASVKEKKAVVIFNKRRNSEELYFVGKKVSFLNTHERKNNHGKPDHESPVTEFQYVPNNKIVMVKGTYMKNGERKKLSKIVGTFAKDQTLADEYVKDGDKAASAPTPAGDKAKEVVKAKSAPT